MTGVMKREGWRHAGRGEESRRDKTGGGGRGARKSGTNAGERGDNKEIERECVCARACV